MTTAGSGAQGHDLVLRAGAATDVGRVRDHNEDSLLVTASVFAVADGMGGHAAGEVASRIVTETLEELAERERIVPDDIVAALALANTRLLESAARHPEQTGMGTTATGLSVVSAGGSDHWAVFNVGDSRVYRLVDAELNLVTVDHSEVQEMIDAGLLTPEQAARHPLRNIVTRSLGTEVTPVPDLWVFPPSPGERFVICSDGPPTSSAASRSAGSSPTSTIRSRRRGRWWPPPWRQAGVTTSRPSWWPSMPVRRSLTSALTPRPGARRGRPSEWRHHVDLGGTPLVAVGSRGPRHTLRFRRRSCRPRRRRRPRC